MPEVKGLSDGVTHVKELVLWPVSSRAGDECHIPTVLITPLPFHLFQKININ